MSDAQIDQVVDEIARRVQARLTGGATLAAHIGALYDERARLHQMAGAMRALGRPNAAGAVVDWLEQHAIVR